MDEPRFFLLRPCPVTPAFSTAPTAVTVPLGGAGDKSRVAHGLSTEHPAAVQLRSTLHPLFFSRTISSVTVS